MCVCVCVRAHARVWAYIDMWEYIYIHIYIYMCVYVHMYICGHIYLYKSLYTSVYMYGKCVDIKMCFGVCFCVCVCVCVYSANYFFMPLTSHDALVRLPYWIFLELLQLSLFTQCHLSINNLSIRRCPFTRLRLQNWLLVRKHCYLFLLRNHWKY